MLHKIAATVLCPILIFYCNFMQCLEPRILGTIMASVNLVKYKDEMLNAWEDVVNNKTPTNWALFTYDAQSYDLKYFSKGGNCTFPLTSKLFHLNI